MAAPEQKIPEKMKGVRVVAYVDDKKEMERALKLEQDLPVPKLSSGQVLVQVKAASINPVDWKIATGYLSLIKSPPFIAGFDFAGKVVAVGSSCKRIKVGDSVYGMSHFTILGSFAEYLALPEAHVVPKPPTLTYSEAASLPLVALTSYQALLTAGLKQNHKVLILGGSGGTGAVGIQIAKAMGASEIVATCSQRNVEFVRQQGATKVIDYQTQNWAEELKGQQFDVVYDTVGGYKSWTDSWQVLSSKGYFVTISGDVQSKLTIGKLVGTGLSIVNRKFWSWFPYPGYSAVRCDAAKPDQLEIFNKWVSEGKMRPTVEKTFAFEDFVKMYEHSIAGRTVGKLTLAVSADAHDK